LIHEHVRPQTVGVLRAGIFAIWLVKIAPDQLTFLAELPRSIFRPAGFLQFVPDEAWPLLLTAGTLGVFKAVIILSLVLAMIGARPYKAIAIFCAAALTIHQGLVRSFTFVNHQELPILFAVYVLAFYPAADGFTWPARKPAATNQQIYSGALVTITLLLLLPYTAAAAYRLAYSAPGIFLSDSMPYWLGSLSGLDADGWSLGLWVLDYPILVSAFKLVFPVTTGFELLAPLCIVWLRFRRVWLAVMIAFHLLSWFLLNIFFWENLLLIAVLLSDVDQVYGRLANRFMQRTEKFAPV
jgi:hypothetical protein